MQSISQTCTAEASAPSGGYVWVSVSTWLFFCLIFSHGAAFTRHDVRPPTDTVMSQRVLCTLASLAVLLVAACAPSLSPLHRDYAVSEPARSSDTKRIVHALESAGWAVSDTTLAVVTDERTLSEWGLYRVVASLEVVPLGPDHVRVFIHPYRRYFTGSRSKLPFLKRSVRQAVLPDLHAAFEAEGLQPLGTQSQRDRRTVAR